MGHFTHMGSESREAIGGVIDDWKKNCLLADGSVFWDEKVWTLEAASDADERFNGNLLLSHDQSFEEKLKKQLDGADEATYSFVAEATLIYWIGCAWQVQPETKREQIRTVLNWGGIEISEDLEETPAWEAMDHGLASAGSGYLFNRWREIGYIFKWVHEWKKLDSSRRKELLGDPEAFKNWIDQATGDDGRQFRNIILHLLWPDQFERIFSSAHKRLIADTFSDLANPDAEDVDDQLAQIRLRLRELAAKATPQDIEDWMEAGPDGLIPDEEFDFYRAPVEDIWRTENAGDLPALLFKKSLVLYGPPGTGKTYEAERLAETVIRQVAIDQWGGDGYFERLEETQRAFKNHIHRLQLHPAYSYEDFIGGLRITESSGVEYKPGFLLSLCQRINESSSDLPHVLILDEMNRVDLSRMFGEAFSALERDRRGQPVDLATEDPKTGLPRQLVIPENFYVVGTMNMIDQSLEQVDFALRRRFLWQESRYDEEVLIKVLQNRWETSSRKAGWERVEADMRGLAKAATRLNLAIEETEELGSQYEIGHTYFFDIVDLLSYELTPGMSRFLWSKKGEPKPAVENLWNLALRPLIEDYLAGLDTERREQVVGELRSAFFD